MSLTEYQRLQVLKWFEEAMGAELGADMMKLLPPVGWGDLATKADLRALEDRLDLRVDGVALTMRGEMAELRSELRGEMAELRGEMAELRGEMSGLRGEMSGLRGELAAEIRGQTRSLFLSLVGLQMTAAALAVTVARMV